METANLVTNPFGIGEKLILELLNRGESVYTIFSSPKDVPMSFLGKINLKYGFIKFDRDVNLEKVLPRGPLAGRLSGLGLVAWGAWLAGSALI